MCCNVQCYINIYKYNTRAIRYTSIIVYFTKQSCLITISYYVYKFSFWMYNLISSMFVIIGLSILSNYIKKQEFM